MHLFNNKNIVNLDDLLLSKNNLDEVSQKNLTTNDSFECKIKKSYNNGDNFDKNKNKFYNNKNDKNGKSIYLNSKELKLKEKIKNNYKTLKNLEEINNNLKNKINYLNNIKNYKYGKNYINDLKPSFESLNSNYYNWNKKFISNKLELKNIKDKIDKLKKENKFKLTVNKKLDLKLNKFNNWKEEYKLIKNHFLDLKEIMNNINQSVIKDTFNLKISHEKFHSNIFLEKIIDILINNVNKINNSKVNNLIEIIKKLD